MLTNNRLVIYTTDQKLESFFFFYQVCIYLMKNSNILK